MPEITSDHIQRWSITIKREDIDNWPDIAFKRVTAASAGMRPSRIAIILEPAVSEKPRIEVSGARLRKNGTAAPSLAYEYDPPEWAQELAIQARTRLGLGPAKTGVDW
jgi:hypothetical protein